MARLLLSTLLSIATPPSVKANGFAPPKWATDGIKPFATASLISASFNVNMKSEGKRCLLRRTACFNARVSTS